MNSTVLSTDLLLLFLLASIVIAAAVFYRFAAKKYAGGFLPIPAPQPSRPFRIVQSILLGCIVAFFIAQLAFVQEYAGFLIDTDRLRPIYADFRLALFGVAVLCSLVAVVLAGRGKVMGGPLLFCLISATVLLLGNRDTSEWFLPASWTKPVYKIGFSITSEDGSILDGAELWLNGVCLGKTPLEITQDELEAKVPVWDDPPEDFKSDIIEKKSYSPSGWSEGRSSRWLKIDLSLYRFEKGHWTTMTRSEDREKNGYYVRIRYAGEWAGMNGSGGTGGSWNFILSTTAYLPNRNARLTALLNQARLADYRVDPSWFRAAETYGNDAWIEMTKLLPKEPRIKEVLDGWTQERYRLDQATDAESAWRLFEKIGYEADELHAYSTGSVAGGAVERLFPLLAQEKILERAENVLRRRPYLNYQRRGTGESAILSSNDTIDRSRTATDRAEDAKRLKPSDICVAHALWLLHKRLVAEKATEPNVLQTRISPLLLRNYSQINGSSFLDDFTQLTLSIGGPAIDQFLLHQRWDIPVSDFDQVNRMWIRGATINKWLYMLAYLNDDAGREFRREHLDRFVELGKNILKQRHGFDSVNDIDFVFLDEKIALAFYPHFVRAVLTNNSSDALQQLWAYLIRLGDAAEPEMFVAAVQQTSESRPFFQNSLDLLYKINPPLRRKVIDALVDAVSHNPPFVAEYLRTHGGKSDNLIEEITARLADPQRDAESRKALATYSGSSAKFSEEMAMPLEHWLADSQPNTPILRPWAESKNPHCRLLTLKAIQSCPTPDNRIILAEMSHDADPAVASAACDVQTLLKKRADESPDTYRSDRETAEQAVN